MRIFLQFLGAVLVGTAIGAYALPNLSSPQATIVENSSETGNASYTDDSRDLIDNLQQQLLQANKERNQLKQQVKQLLSDSEVDSDPVSSNDDAESFIERFQELSNGEVTREQRIEQIREARSPAAQQQRLLDAGFSEDELASIERAQADNQTEQLEARLQEMRDNPEDYERLLDPRGYQPIREQLGDDRFEDYLLASGANPVVTTRNVTPGSAADIAGIQAGDQIYSYDGARVFQAGDVTRGTISGNVNDNVIIEVKRNDEIVTLSAPRGTLGVTLNNNQRGGNRIGGGMGRGP